MGHLGKERRMPGEIGITPEILRQLQLIQLEILIEFDRICRKHGIRYSLDGGTLLGAVRHGGFIPWDDDIDVILPRREYERFFTACKTELDSRFFLQEHRTDRGYRVGYPRLRRNNTVYRRAGHERMTYHGGVFIDLFVLDNVPDNPILRRLHRALCFCNRKILWSGGGRFLAKNPLMRAWYFLVSLIPAAFAFASDSALARACNKKPTELVRHNTHPYPNTAALRYGMPAELLGEYTELSFEGRPFMAIRPHARYLALLYGDYMRLPPPEKRRPSIRLSAFEPVKEEENTCT